MGMSAQDVSHDWTAEMAMALPDDGNRYEVLDGELFVTPAPRLRHQEALVRLFEEIKPFVTTHRLGWMFWSPADIRFSPRRLVQPDLFVVPWRDGGKPSAWTEVKSLLLAVEVLSPSTAHADRLRKRLIYQDEGVPEYWIVDLDARLVERWRPGDLRPEIVDGTLEWQPRAEIDPLRVDLQVLFEDVLGSGMPSPPSREGDDTESAP